MKSSYFSYKTKIQEKIFKIYLQAHKFEIVFKLNIQNAALSGL